MVTVTVSVPAELKKEMDELPEMNWSEVARQAFAQKVRDLKFLEHLTAESKFTEEDAQQLGRKANAAIGKKYDELYNKWKKERSGAK